MTRDEILRILKENKPTLQKEYNITTIGLFGSYASDTSTRRSDIDIAIEMKSPYTFRQFFNAKYFLEKLLKKKVDLGFEHTLRKELRALIKKQMIYV